ncbi:MAG: hypothetical protein AB8B48_15060 [Pseudomonadales bacterium]
MKTVRAFTWLDLIVCASFALPIASDVTLWLLSAVSVQLGWAPISVSTAAAGFFVNLAGMFGVLWNIVMLKNADKKLHHVDLVARVWLIGVIAFYIAEFDLSPLFAVFIVTEVLGGWFKWNWLRTIKRSSANRA